MYSIGQNKCRTLGRYVPDIYAVIDGAFLRVITILRKYVIKWYNRSHCISWLIFLRVTKNDMFSEKSEEVIRYREFLYRFWEICLEFLVQVDLGKFWSVFCQNWVLNILDFWVKSSVSKEQRGVYRWVSQNITT